MKRIVALSRNICCLLDSWNSDNVYHHRVKQPGVVNSLFYLFSASAVSEVLKMNFTLLVCIFLLYIYEESELFSVKSMEEVILFKYCSLLIFVLVEINVGFPVKYKLHAF